MKEKTKKKRHPDYGLVDQAKGRCPYCLASAEMDCDCEKSTPQQGDWEKDLAIIHRNYESTVLLIRQLLLKKREEQEKIFKQRYLIEFDKWCRRNCEGKSKTL